MSRPPLATRLHFSSNERHRNAVISWLTRSNSRSQRRRANEKHRDAVLTWRPDFGIPKPQVAVFVQEKATERVYVLYDNDPEELLDGYEGKMSISRYQQSRLR